MKMQLSIQYLYFFLQLSLPQKIIYVRMLNTYHPQDPFLKFLNYNLSTEFFHLDIFHAVATLL